MDKMDTHKHTQAHTVRLACMNKSTVESHQPSRISVSTCSLSSPDKYCRRLRQSDELLLFHGCGRLAAHLGQVTSPGLARVGSGWRVESKKREKKGWKDGVWRWGRGRLLIAGLLAPPCQHISTGVTRRDSDLFVE